MRRRYLVTGAAGFLGTNICMQLLEKGERVRALVLPNDPSAAFVPKEAEICRGDLCSPEDVDRFFTVPEGTESVVIHCASIVTMDPDYSQKVMDVNVGGTRNIVNACLAHRECKKLVYVSSTGAIPELPKGTPISEVDSFAPADPEKVVGCYSQSKAEATQLVLDAVRKQGLNACVVHPSGILGPNDPAVGVVTGTLLKIIRGEMPIGLAGSFNLCDVRDLAAGCIAAVDRGRTGECYILGNQEITMKQLCKILHKETGCKRVRLFLPLSLAERYAVSEEKKAAKKGKKPLLTRFSVYNLARNNTFDSAKARRELGYRTRSYRETIHDEVEWMKRRELIPSAS